MILTIHTDGGSRGNPGHSGFGVVIEDENRQNLYQEGFYLGIKTNNEAEYAGLIHALEWVLKYQNEHNIDSTTIYMDSELIVRQVNGQYQVKASHLKPLYLHCLDLISRIKSPLSFSHTLREGNEMADSLANLAMDRRYNKS